MEEKGLGGHVADAQTPRQAKAPPAWRLRLLGRLDGQRRVRFTSRYRDEILAAKACFFAEEVKPLHPQGGVGVVLMPK